MAKIVYPHREVYVRDDGKWAWRLVAENETIIATDGGDGYESKEHARDMVDRILGGEFSNAKKYTTSSRR